MNEEIARTEDSDGPVVVVLGASGGIGSALSRRLSAAGYRLTLFARGKEPLEELAANLGAEVSTGNATDFGAVESLLLAARERHGRLDAVVNCVGSVFLRPAHLTSREDFDRVVETNLASAFATVRAGVRALRGEGGAIVLVSSGAARTGLANHEAVAAAKAGVEGLVRAAAATYARSGIRVNAVAPGLVRTPATRRITENEAGREASLAMHAVGRLGEPADIAAAIAWLLSPDASWVTGEVLRVDGGLASVRTGA